MSTPIAGTGDKYSWAQLFNPISFITSSTGDRYPEFMNSIFPGNQKAAYLTSKAAAIGLLTAGIVGSVRLAQHIKNKKKLDQNKDKRLQSQLATTYEGDLNPKTASQITPTGPTDPVGSLSVVLPLVAAIIGGAAAYKGVDSWADSNLNKIYDQSIHAKGNQLKNIMKVRAQLAKGNASERDVRNAILGAQQNQAYVKSASLDKKAVVGESIAMLVLLAAAVAGAAGIGSYLFVDKNMPQNIKYKAYQKALNQFAAGRVARTPITINPTDADKLFSQIDNPTKSRTAQTVKKENEEEEEPKQQLARVSNVRSLPERNFEVTNKPISISLD